MRFAYVAGALNYLRNNSDAEDRRPFYEDIGKFLEDFGFQPFISHLHNTNPLAEKITPLEILENNEQAIRKADLVVADLFVPSIGVGYEIRMAMELGKPVVCLQKENTQTSRMVLGNVKKGRIFLLEYKDEADALKKLETFLNSLKLSGTF